MLEGSVSLKLLLDLLKIYHILLLYTRYVLLLVILMCLKWLSTHYCMFCCSIAHDFRQSEGRGRDGWKKWANDGLNLPILFGYLVVTIL